MRRFMLNLVAIASLLAPVAMPAVAAAAPNTSCPGGSAGQVLNGIGESGNNCDDSGFGKVVSEIVSLISYIAGVLAVIMIISAGIKYTTSGGDSAKISNAKGTLIYALIGLAVAVLAQVLVHYVLSTSNNLASK